MYLRSSEPRHIQFFRVSKSPSNRSYRKRRIMWERIGAVPREKTVKVQSIHKQKRSRTISKTAKLISSLFSTRSVMVATSSWLGHAE